MHHQQGVLPLHGQAGLSLLPLRILLLWLIFVTPIYLPNMGGSGLKLPQNIITWAFMAASVTTIWLTLPVRRTIRLTMTAKWLLLAVVILAIPLLYTLPQWRDAAFARWLGLLGGWVFYLSWLQYSTPHQCRHWLFYAILAATVFQVLMALLQFMAPQVVPSWLAYPMQNGRPYGVFQQVNVLASFIATGLALALMLFLLPRFSFVHSKLERYRKYALGFMLILFSTILVWLQSRIGWLGGSIAAAFLLLLVWKQDKKQAGIAFGLMVFGIVCAIVFHLEGGIEHIEHTDSNHARLIMLRDSLRMIAEKPWFGWGYGGFEYSFQHYRLALARSTVGLGVVSHPHNEILLWWAEGGLVALSGMAIILMASTRLVWHSWKKSRQIQQIGNAKPNESLALAITLLPLLLHSQTEYPFTLSAAHWAIVLLLLARLDLQLATVTKRISLSPATSAFLGGALPAISIAVCALAGVGLYANLCLTSVERNNFLDIEPARQAMRFDLWVNDERWLYDRQVHALLVFNQTHDPLLLDGYAHWANSYLARRIDKNVYASWLAIAQYQQDATTHRRLRQEAQVLFPEDPRFLANFIHQQ